MGAGPDEPGGRGGALNSGHFQNCLKLLFCCHEFNMNQHHMKWACGILATSDLLSLLSKQPSQREGREPPHFLSPNLLQKGVICQFYGMKKVHRSVQSKQMSCFRRHGWKVPQGPCRNHPSKPSVTAQPAAGC